MSSDDRQKKSLSSVVSAFLIFIIAASTMLVVYVSVFVDDRGVFGYSMFTIITSSMQGTIEEGEFILVKRVLEKDLREGMVITFISSDEEIKGKKNTHRIHSFEDGKIFTKGDNNDYIDSAPTRYEDVIGEVKVHSLWLGRAISWMQVPRNMLLYIILPTLLFGFLDMGSAIKAVKRSIAQLKNGEGKGARGEVFGGEILNLVMNDSFYIDRNEGLKILGKLNRKIVIEVYA